MRINIPNANKVSISQREVIKVVSPDKHVMEMYHAASNMDETMAMEITYTRAK